MSCVLFNLLLARPRVPAPLIRRPPIAPPGPGFKLARPTVTQTTISFVGYSLLFPESERTGPRVERGEKSSSESVITCLLGYAELADSAKMPGNVESGPAFKNGRTPSQSNAKKGFPNHRGAAMALGVLGEA